MCVCVRGSSPLELPVPCFMHALRLDRASDRDAACFQSYIGQAAGLGNAKITTWAHALNASFAARRETVRWLSSAPEQRARPLVLGGGFGSTGTTSLLQALEKIGLVAWHAAYGPAVNSTSPNDFRLGIMTPWFGAGSVDACHVRLNAATYRLPSGVGAIVDRPTAEAFFDFWWANPSATVVLTRRPGRDWVRSRVAKFQRRDAMPVDRPCGLRLSDARSDDEIVRLLRFHDEAVRCVVPAERLVEVNVFAQRGSDGLMDRLRRAALGPTEAAAAAAAAAATAAAAAAAAASASGTVNGSSNNSASSSSSSSSSAAAAHAHEAAQRFPHANKFPRANVCSRQQLRRVYVNGKSRTVCSTKIVPLPKQGVG